MLSYSVLASCRSVGLLNSKVPRWSQTETGAALTP